MQKETKRAVTDELRPLAAARVYTGDIIKETKGVTDELRPLAAARADTGDITKETKGVTNELRPLAAARVYTGDITKETKGVTDELRPLAAARADTGDITKETHRKQKITKINLRKSLCTQHLTVVKESTTYPEVGDDCIRFVCISDTHSQVETNHNFLSHVPSGDVLLHAGDFTLYGDVCEIEEFNQFLAKLPHPIKVVIPGNHETSLDPRGFVHDVPGLRRLLQLPPCNDATNPTNYKEVREAVAKLVTNAVLLIDDAVQICGVKIYGYPWVPRHGALGFGLKRAKELCVTSGQIPGDIDILLSHGPANGYGDLTSSGKHAGCCHLANNVTERIKPKLVVSGHIHEGYGVFTNGETTFINAAVCNRGYRPKQPPIVVDYKLPVGYTRDDLIRLTHKDLQIISPTNQLSSSSLSKTEAATSPPHHPPPPAPLTTAASTSSSPPPIPPRSNNKFNREFKPVQVSTQTLDNILSQYNASVV